MNNIAPAITSWSAATASCRFAFRLIGNRRLVAAALLILLALPALASSPEYLVGGTAARPAANGRYSPSIATDGDGFLVAWADERTGSGSVIASRVTREGRILDPLGIRVSTVDGWVMDPQVAWDGSGYLVVWTVRDRLHYRSSIFAARIGPNGGVVMPPRLIVDDGFTYRGRYLASNGTVSVIAYLGDGARMAVLDRDGNLLHDETLASSNTVYDLTVVAGTSRFVAAWSTNFGYSVEDEVIQAVPLTASGHVIGSPVTVLPGEHPAIGTDGTRFTIASEKNEHWETFAVLSRTFDQDLAPVGEQHSLIPGRTNFTHVLRVGNHYEVVTVRYVSGGVNELLSVALDANGNPQGPVRSRGQYYGEPIAERLTAATNGVDVLVARANRGAADVGLQIFSQLYPANTIAPVVPTLVSWSGNAHRAPDVASSTAGTLVAWAEDGGVFATRIDRDGHSLDGRGIALSTYWYGRVRTAFNGTSYVVAWRDRDFIGVRYIDPLTGQTVAEAHVPGQRLEDLALAASADATYLAFINEHRVRVTRIPHTTYTPDPVPLAVSPEDMIVDYPAAAWNGSTLLVTWTEEYRESRADPPSSVSINVHAARVSAGLSLLDPAPLLVATTASSDEGPTEALGPPSVASDGTDWLVATTFQYENVVARRVLQDGTVKGNAPVKIGDGSMPAVAWDGTRYAVAWKEGNNQQLVRPVVLAAVPKFGALTVTKRAFVAQSTTTTAPAIAPAGLGESAVVYTRVSFLPEHAAVERSFFRVMDFDRRGRVIRR